jgi:hypothetical protein
LSSTCTPAPGIPAAASTARTAASGPETASAATHLEAVNAGGGQPQRREHPVDVGDRAAAEDGERPVEARMDRGEAAWQRRVHPDGLRPCGDVDQRAVEIEEQRRRRINGKNLHCGPL